MRKFVTGPVLFVSFYCTFLYFVLVRCFVFLSHYFLFIFVVFLVCRGFFVSFDQGGTGVPCAPLSVFLEPFLSRLHALPVVVGGGGRVYAWFWSIDGGGLLL